MFFRFLLCIVLPLHVVGDACPQTTSEFGKWVHKESVGKCYGGIPKNTVKALSYGEAERWCRQQGSHLALPKTETEVGEITAVSSSFISNEASMWIGLDQNGLGIDVSSKWVDAVVNLTVLVNSLMQRMAGKPNIPGSKDCVKMVRNKFAVDHCWSRQPFLCELPDWLLYSPLNTQPCPKDWTQFECGEFCYFASHTKFTKTNAWDYCRKLGEQTHIAMPKTLKQHKAVALMLQRDNQSDLEGSEAWIGLAKKHSPSQYEWDDGIIETWIYWGASKPKTESTELCITMNMKGSINIRKCSDLKYVVCQQAQKPANISNISKCGKTARNRSAISHARRLQPEVTSPDIKSGTDGGNVRSVDHPWIVRVSNPSNLNGSVICGGVLIGTRHVLTTADCLRDKGNNISRTSEINVGMNSADLRFDNGKLEPVHMIRIHPGRVSHASESDGVYYDIVILELKRAVLTGCPNVRSACLPEKPFSSYPLNSTHCQLVGWGKGGGDKIKGININITQEIIADTNSMFKDSLNQTYHPGSGDVVMCLDESSDMPSWAVVGIYVNKIRRYQHVNDHWQWIKSVIEGRENARQSGRNRKRQKRAKEPPTNSTTEAPSTPTTTDDSMNHEPITFRQKLIITGVFSFILFAGVVTACAYYCHKYTESGCLCCACCRKANQGGSDTSVIRKSKSSTTSSDKKVARKTGKDTKVAVNTIEDKVTKKKPITEVKSETETGSPDKMKPGCYTNLKKIFPPRVRWGRNIIFDQSKPPVRRKSSTPIKSVLKQPVSPLPKVKKPPSVVIKSPPMTQRPSIESSSSFQTVKSGQTLSTEGSLGLSTDSGSSGSSGSSKYSESGSSTSSMSSYFKSVKYTETLGSKATKHEKTKGSRMPKSSLTIPVRAPRSLKNLAQPRSSFSSEKSGKSTESNKST